MIMKPTPDDMREQSANAFNAIKSGLAKENNPQSAQLSALCHLMQAAWEIAAQLSELNQRLAERSL